MSSPWDPQHRPPHGQPPYQQYQGFGAFQQQPPPQQPGWWSPYPPVQPPKKQRGSLILALVVAGIAVLAVIVALGVAVAGLQRPAQSPAPGPHSPIPTSVSAHASPGPQPAPVTPGWQVITVPGRSAVYDVPPEWRPPAAPQAVIGFGDPQDAVTMSGVANYLPGFCPGQPTSFRATAGVTGGNGPNDATVAADTAQKFVTLAYTRHGIAPIATQAPPLPIALPNGAPAFRVDSTVTLPAPDPCDAPVVAVSVVATGNAGGGSVVFIAAADQGIPGAVTPDVLNRISGSLRPR